MIYLSPRSMVRRRTTGGFEVLKCWGVGVLKLARYKLKVNGRSNQRLPHRAIMVESRSTDFQFKRRLLQHLNTSTLQHYLLSTLHAPGPVRKKSNPNNANINGCWSSYQNRPFPTKKV